MEQKTRYKLLPVLSTYEPHFTNRHSYITRTTTSWLDYENEESERSFKARTLRVNAALCVVLLLAGCAILYLAQTLFDYEAIDYRDYVVAVLILCALRIIYGHRVPGADIVSTSDYMMPDCNNLSRDEKDFLELVSSDPSHMYYDAVQDILKRATESSDNSKLPQVLQGFVEDIC